MSPRWKYWIPMLLLAIVGGFALRGLSEPKDEFVHSAMVGKKLPAFALKPATEGVEGLNAQDFADDKPRLLNLFGSYCIPCIAEAPQLDALKKAGAEIDAVAISDKPEGVAEFLKKYGNPFTRIGDDPTGSLQLALGASGVPETYVIAGDGTIIYQHIGDIRADDVPMLLGKLKEVQR